MYTYAYMYHKVRYKHTRAKGLGEGGRSLRGKGGGYGRERKTEIDNAPRWVTVGDEGSHGGREKGGDYERAGRSW